MMLLRKLVRDSAIYGGGDFFLKLIAFFTFPVLATSLSSTNFGLLELAMTVVSLGGIFVRCGLNNAVQRFYWDQTVPEKQRPILVSTGLFITIVFGVICAFLAYGLSPIIISIVSGDTLKLGSFGVLAVALLLVISQWCQYLQDILRLHFAPWKFLAFTFVSRALGSLMALAAVLYFGAGVDGVLIAQALVLLSAMPLGLWLARKDLILKVDTCWSRRLLVFGTPFIFTELAYWLFASIDRWMLASMSGIHEVGLYSVAFRFSTLAVFIATAFGMAWSPYAVKIRVDHPEEHRKIYAEVLLILLVVMLSVAGFIALFSGEIIGILLPSEYFSAAVPLAVLCFTTVLQASQQVTAIGISLVNRTKIFAYLVWLAAAMNILLNFYLIPRYGAVGAAWATVMAYFFLSSGFLYYTQRYYPLPISWGRLLWICLLGCIVLLVGVLFQRNVIDLGVVLVKVVIAIVCLLLAWPALDMKVFRGL